MASTPEKSKPVPFEGGRRTKIVATLGPASSTAQVIGDLIEAGVNVFRLNFSHGNHEQHLSSANIIREQANLRDVHVGILADLQGPKIRLGELQGGQRELQQDDRIILSVGDAKGDNIIPVDYDALPLQVSVGDVLLIDDGFIRVIVESTDEQQVECIVDQPGLLKSRKGINRLGGGLSATAVTEKDGRDAEFAVAQQFDYIAVSFPEKPSCLEPVRKAIAAAGNSHTQIIAKIERAEAVQSTAALEALISAADGVMVARGDLGVEIGDAQLIGVQKDIIAAARRANKPVITATQMMESMISQPVPTRAEVFDVANAVLDGTDAVMLSAETAAGEYPVEVVMAMSKTAMGAELHPSMSESSYRVERMFSAIDETIAMSVMYAANHLEDIRAIVCLTESGTTPLLASRLTSTLPIYGVSRHTATCCRMALYRGVVPLYFDVTRAGGDIWGAAMALIAERGGLNAGDRVAITCGDLQGEGGSTNTVKILQYLG